MAIFLSHVSSDFNFEILLRLLGALFPSLLCIETDPQKRELLSSAVNSFDLFARQQLESTSSYSGLCEFEQRLQKRATAFIAELIQPSKGDGLLAAPQEMSDLLVAHNLQVIELIAIRPFIWLSIAEKRLAGLPMQQKGPRNSGRTSAVAQTPDEGEVFWANVDELMVRCRWNITHFLNKCNKKIDKCGKKPGGSFPVYSTFYRWRKGRKIPPAEKAEVMAAVFEEYLGVRITVADLMRLDIDQMLKRSSAASSSYFPAQK